MERKLRMPECNVCACPRTAAFKEAKGNHLMKEPKESAASGRIIGLDLQPDVFSAAALSGPDGRAERQRAARTARSGELWPG